jgi:phage/plasmid-like protein (TIGR03299 family)
MSAETTAWLNENTLIGYAEKRGNAWHHRAGTDNHYEGAIPVEDVERRLFAWDLVSAPLAYSVGGETIEAPGRQAIVRSDNHELLGIFREGYQIHQYREWLIRNVGTLLDSDGLQIGSAGLLRKGGQAWVQAEPAEGLNVGGFEIRPFLLAATSADGSLATTYAAASTATVCDNTLALALHSAGDARVKIRHTANSLKKIHDAREALGIVVATGEAYAAEIERLGNVAVTDAEWAEFVNAHTGLDKAESLSPRALTMAENYAGRLAQLWNADERVAPWSGSALGVLQAVNTERQHLSIVRGAERWERTQSNFLTGKSEKADMAALATLGRITGDPVLIGA